jgi:hypothetical protein
MRFGAIDEQPVNTYEGTRFEPRGHAKRWSEQLVQIDKETGPQGVQMCTAHQPKVA